MIRVQMVGTQRSGSNLLRMILGWHEGVFAPPSVHMYQVLRRVSSGYGDLGLTRNRRALIDDLRTLIGLNVLEWPSGPPGTGQIEREWSDESLAGLFSAVHDAAAGIESSGAWISKSLENVKYLGELVRAVPDLLILHLIRDGRDVALSFRSAPIGPKHPVLAAHMWAGDQRLADQYVSVASAGSVIRISYERMTSDPSGTLSPLLSRLGTKFDPQSLKFNESAEAQRVPSLSRLWHNLDRPVIANNSRFRQPEVHEFVELFEGAAFESLISYGYSPLYASRPVKYNASELRLFQEEDSQLRSAVRASADPAIEALHSRQADFIAELERRARSVGA